jgi:hypothetical protein
MFYTSEVVGSTRRHLIMSFSCLHLLASLNQVRVQEVTVQPHQ